MLHHLFFLPFVIFHFVVTALLIADGSDRIFAAGSWPHATVVRSAQPSFRSPRAYR